MRIVRSPMKRLMYNTLMSRGTLLTAGRLIGVVFRDVDLYGTDG